MKEMKQTSHLPILILILLSAFLPSTAQESTRELGLPAPTGEYAIGRTSFYWKDSTRQEVMTDDPNDQRELRVQLWYPAEPDPKAIPAPYLSDQKAQKSLLAGDYNRLVAVRTHAIEEAKISNNLPSYPLLIFMHGAGSKGAFYSSIIEELASHGYFVAAIDHTYDSFGVAFPDGRVMRQSDKYAKMMALPPGDEGRESFFVERYYVMAEDAVFVLNQLVKLNANQGSSRFGRRLDLSRVGVFGHSLGGPSAARACQIDRRFRAALNLDGVSKARPFILDTQGRGPEQPFMLINSPWPNADDIPDARLAEWKTTRDELRARWASMGNSQDAHLRTVKSGSYRVTSRVINHSRFTDNAFINPNAITDPARQSAGQIAMQIIRDYSRAFFDKHLLNKRAPLLDGPSPEHPEVRLEIFRPEAGK